MPKTIFHSSEKSNFILNLDLEKYRRFCAKLLAALLFCVGGAAAVRQLTESVNSDINDMVAGEGFGVFLGMLLIVLRSIATVFSIVGVLVMIAVIIGMVRKQFSLKNILPYGLLLGLLVWGLVSLLHSFDFYGALVGQDGRDEGLFALALYAMAFLLASQLRQTGNRRKFITLVLGFGAVQCVWGILQAMPCFDFPNTYNFIDPLLLQKVKLPSGLTDSPITFAMLLTMLVCIAIPAAICGETKRFRVFATICAALDMVMLLKTQTIAGLIGAGLGLLLGIVLCIAQGKKMNAKSWVLPIAMLGSLAVSAVWVYFTPSLNGIYRTADHSQIDNGFVLYDGGVIWDDGFFRLGTQSPYNHFVNPDFEIESAVSTVGYAWQEGIRTIKRYPVVGTGPDCFWYMQLRRSMMLTANFNGVDRPYNDFLYVAASRGIPSLVLYVVLLIVCLLRGIKRRKETNDWTFLSAIFAVIGFAAASVVGISVLTVSPLMWMMLGILIAEPIADKITVPKAEA